MKRRDFFDKLFKTTVVIPVVPSVLMDSEKCIKDFHESVPEELPRDESLTTNGPTTFGASDYFFTVTGW
jgi:hypothetical protein